MAVVIETTLGDITVDLFVKQRPTTCLNFLKLCKMKYYNFNLFHTIQSGFIAQTGDPTGEGTGGQSIFGLVEGPDKRFFSGEKMPKIRHADAGLLSMVSTGESMIGSQFFFTLGPDLDSLDGVHCVIGSVTEGQDVLRKLNDVICDETHRPYQDVRITHTVVLEDPFSDPIGMKVPSRSPSPSAERLKGGRIAPDEELDETQGKSVQEIQEMIEEKEAKARATILEIVGDLPDADVAPPENVLFVCKLNPVTTDEDLEIIFSRFGTIVGCEVIRDKKTGDSLQYAFIEFDDQKSCEEAYFKMDNVLIDDRRIHVDFSQSVSKMRWLGKGKGIRHLDDNGRDKGKKIDKNDSYRFSRNDRKDNSSSRHDRISDNRNERKPRHKDNITSDHRVNKLSENVDRKIDKRQERQSSNKRMDSKHERDRGTDRNKSRNSPLKNDDNVKDKTHERHKDRSERNSGFYKDLESKQHEKRLDLKDKRERTESKSSHHKDERNSRFYKDSDSNRYEKGGTDQTDRSESRSSNHKVVTYKEKKLTSSDSNNSSTVYDKENNMLDNSRKGKKSRTNGFEDDEKAHLEKKEKKHHHDVLNKKSSLDKNEDDSKNKKHSKNKSKDQKHNVNKDKQSNEESHKNNNKIAKESTSSKKDRKTKTLTDKPKSKSHIKIAKKRKRESTSNSSSDSSSDTSSSSSDSSSSDSSDAKTKKKKKRKHSTTSSSSSTGSSSSSSSSDSSSSSSSSSSSDSYEPKKKKKKVSKKPAQKLKKK